jgi:stage IV sporulation protein FA
MSFNQYKEGVRKRRQERLELLRRKQRNLSSTSYVLSNKPSDGSSGFSDFNAMSESEEQQNNQRLYPTLIKILCSFLLITGVYMVMKSDQPLFADAQGFIIEVMHREYNVTGVMTWYEQRVGEQPSFLPKLIDRNNREHSTPVQAYVVPVSSGKVVSSFGQNQQGIMVGTTTTLPVEVVKEGWVRFVGEREGLGQTVIIDHGHGEESWYGQLQDLKVQANDWVMQGEVVGTTSLSVESGQGQFYFALKKNTGFIDPMEVISFD